MIKKLIYLLLTVAAPLTCRAESFKEVFVDAKGAQLFCRTCGSGNPLIVIHGGPGMSQDYLLPQMAKLAENNFVIFYDQRACGRSTGGITPDTMQMKVFLEDVEAIRKHFCFDRVAVLGHSWGGFVAMQYAIAHPDAVQKLILSNTVPATSDGFSLFVKEWIRRSAPFKVELDELHNMPGYSAGDPELRERYFRIIFRTYCFIPKKADLLNLRMTPQAFLNGEKVNEQMRQNVLMKKFDLLDQLRTLKMPTLIIHGESDPIPVVAVEPIHESISGSQFVLMSSCGHFPYVEDPDSYFTKLAEFLNGDR